MQFSVRVLSPDNLITTLQVDAQDEVTALRQVEHRGLMVVEVQSSVSLQVSRRVQGSRSGSGSFQLVLFSEALHALMAAGLSLTESLEALSERESAGATQEIVTRLLHSLREGRRFSDALAALPDSFPALYVGMMRAAEGTSDLPRALQRYLYYRRQLDSVRAKLVSAGIYPAILLVVGSAVSLFLMIYVVPRFASVYQGRGGDLPWMSKLMLAWGEFASAHALPLLAIAGLALGALVVSVPRAIRSGALATLLARLPGIGQRLRLYELSRLYLTLGVLLEGGIPLITALDTAASVASAQIRGGIESARTFISDGGALSEAFEAHGLATPISLRLLRVGERSGKLGQMLLQSAAFHDGEFSRWIERFSKAVEPLMMTVIGLIVGVIVILLYMPIFDLAGSF
jgi:general secretion pathway protein F